MRAQNHAREALDAYAAGSNALTYCLGHTRAVGVGGEEGGGDEVGQQVMLLAAEQLGLLELEYLGGCTIYLFIYIYVYIIVCVFRV